MDAAYYKRTMSVNTQIILGGYRGYNHFDKNMDLILRNFSKNNYGNGILILTRHDLVELFWMVSIVNASGPMNIFTWPVMKYSRTVFPRGTQLSYSLALCSQQIQFKSTNQCTD